MRFLFPWVLGSLFLANGLLSEPSAVCFAAGPPAKNSPASKPGSNSKSVDLRAKTHAALTLKRIPKFNALFEAKPSKLFPAIPLKDGPLVDVLLYEVNSEDGPACILVTNGMSDLPMTEKGSPGASRVELLQYVRRVAKTDVDRLQSTGWIAHFDHFKLLVGDTIHGVGPSTKNSPWPNAIFLPPLPEEYQNPKVSIEGQPLELLWMVPISDAELAWKKKNGTDAFVDLLDKRKFPMIFDPKTRKSLI